MSKRRAALLLALALLLLPACDPRDNEQEGPFLWFAGDVADWSDTSVALGPVPYDGPMEPDALLYALFSGPDKDSGLSSPLPPGTRVLGWSVEGGTLRLDLSRQYGALEGYDLTLANYCLTLTLTQLPGVHRVSISVEGRPMDWELDPDQALLSGAEERPVAVAVALYFPRSAGRGLGVEARVFQLTEGDVLVEEVMRALLGGPENRELSSAIPEGTELRSVRLEDGVCFVDLSHELLDGLPEGEDAQTLLIYSIVNTLGNLSSVSSVSFLVEGSPLERLGEVALPTALDPDFGLSGH